MKCQMSNSEDKKFLSLTTKNFASNVSSFSGNGFNMLDQLQIQRGEIQPWPSSNLAIDFGPPPVKKQT